LGQRERFLEKGATYLLDHQRDDGGWGPSGDATAHDSDCLSTGYVLRFLQSVQNWYSASGVRERADGALQAGAQWLRLHAGEHGGFWVYRDESLPVHYTAEVLAGFPGLRRIDERLHAQTVGHLLSLQDRADGGWPLAPGGRSALEATLAVTRVLAETGGSSHEDSIQRGLAFVGRSIAEQREALVLGCADWAALLHLAVLRDCRILSDEDARLRALARRFSSTSFVRGDFAGALAGLPPEGSPLVGSLCGLAQSTGRRPYVERVVRAARRIPTSIQIGGGVLAAGSLSYGLWTALGGWGLFAAVGTSALVGLLLWLFRHLVRT